MEPTNFSKYANNQLRLTCVHGLNARDQELCFVMITIDELKVSLVFTRKCAKISVRRDMWEENTRMDVVLSSSMAVSRC